MTRAVRFLALLVLALGAETAARQSPPQPRVDDAGSISGRVFAAGTGLPIPGATVRLAGRQLSRATTSDDDGYFELTNVAAGDYLLSAVAAGYAMGAHGQSTPSELPRSFALGARETRQSADVQLTPLGKISGQIVDTDGRPVSKVRVQVFRKALPGIGADDPPNARVVAGTPTPPARLVSPDSPSGTTT
jgi:hypothetical protein